MIDQKVGKDRPVFDRHQGYQVFFDPVALVVFVAGEFQSPGQAHNVGVHHNAFQFAERISQDDVGGLARHAGQREQIGHVVRHVTAEILDDLFRCGADFLTGFFMTLILRG